MAGNIITVTNQVLVLFILMMIGLIVGKLGLVSDRANAGITNVVMYLIIPCTLINAFQFKFEPDQFRQFLSCLIIAIILHIAFFLLSILLIRGKTPEDKRTLVLLATISNCNFIAFPLQLSILGTKGIFLGSAYSAVCAIFNWTVGMVYVTGKRDKESLKKVLLNPALIGLELGLVLYLTQLRLPSVVNTIVGYMSDMAVPLPMLLIGMMLMKSDFKKIIRDWTLWRAILMRLVILPLLCIGGLYLCGIRGEVLVATIIEAAPPAATIVVILSSRFHNSEELAAAGCSISTIVSVVTMPLMIALAQFLA